MSPRNSPGMWQGERPPFRPDAISPTKWLNLLRKGRIAGGTVRGVVAVALAETLYWHFHLASQDSELHPGFEVEVEDDDWLFPSAEAEAASRRIQRGDWLPKYDEVDFFLRHPYFAPVLGSRLLIGVLKLLSDPPASNAVTRESAHGIPMTTTVAPLPDARLDRDVAATCAVRLAQFLAGSDEGEWSEIAKLLAGEASARRVVSLTQRDMLRAVFREGDAPLTAGDVRAEVRRRFPSVEVADRQLAQSLVGLCRDGEIKRVERGVYRATRQLDRQPHPTNPTRKRSRS